MKKQTIPSAGLFPQQILGYIYGEPEFTRPLKVLTPLGALRLLGGNGRPAYSKLRSTISFSSRFGT